MKKSDLTIRPQMVKDAGDFYRILTTGGFEFFPVNVASLEAEKRFLRNNVRDWKAGEAFNFSVLLKGRVIGAVGIMPESGRSYNAEIGYFIAREYQGKGYASEALRLAEDYAVRFLPQIRRFHAIIVVENYASAAVVKKCGFKLEGCLKEYLKVGSGYFDADLYAKLIR